MANRQQKAEEKDEPQDVSAFLGVDPIYQNYSDDRNKPFRAEEDSDLEDDAAVANQTDLATEEVAYSHQEWTREDGGQDPKTGEPLDIDPAEALRQKREQYKDPNWGPNVPHPMTAPQESSTGSTETVQPNGTTGETSSTPPAPPAPATGDGDNK